MVDSVSVRFKTARVQKKAFKHSYTVECGKRLRVGVRVSKKRPLNIRIQWNVGSACVSECVLKTLACRGLRVGPSKLRSLFGWKDD